MHLICRVLGVVDPVDPTAPPINFQVNLPSQWNSKAVQFGGGGFDGFLTTADGPSAQAALVQTPLARGYATFGSNGGHTGSPLDGSFSLNAEARQNWAGDQLKKVHDVAHQLIKTRYSSLPKRQYFLGGSQGGHEGFIVVQRFPNDYDGVVSFYPSYDFMGGILSGVRLMKSFFGTPGAALNPAKQALFRRAVYQTCDALDGAADGIISNPAACESTFQVSTLRCPSGSDEGDTCLSDAQIAALNSATLRTTFPIPLTAGTTSHPRSPIFSGADIEANIFGPDFTNLETGYLGVFASQFVKYFITQNSATDILTFDPNAWTSQILSASNQIDAPSVEIESFSCPRRQANSRARNRRYAGLPGESIDYTNRLVARWGQSVTDSFFRFYLISGQGHGGGCSTHHGTPLRRWTPGSRRGPRLDHKWALTRTQPQRAGRVRCPYPTWPKYKGTGDVNSAASFDCVP